MHLIPVAVPKDFRRKDLDLRACLPCVCRQTCLVTGLLQEGDAIPPVLDGHLRQQQATMLVQAYQQSVPSNF